MTHMLPSKCKTNSIFTPIKYTRLRINYFPSSIAKGSFPLEGVSKSLPSPVEVFRSFTVGDVFNEWVDVFASPDGGIDTVGGTGVDEVEEVEEDDDLSPENIPNILANMEIGLPPFALLSAAFRFFFSNFSISTWYSDT